MSDESRIPAWAGTPARRPRAVVLDRRAGEDPLGKDLVEIIARQLDVVEQGAELQQPEILDEVDLLVVLGGDGSILRAAQQMGTRQRPVIGINLGRLGFLAAISP
ncbi:MAG: NAD(+)/NADH kinase [Planctomycetota bacterium]|nr:NAD(+)/NADH kinase [Planctomycetota bacterium]